MKEFKVNGKEVLSALKKGNFCCDKSYGIMVNGRVKDNKGGSKALCITCNDNAQAATAFTVTEAAEDIEFIVGEEFYSAISVLSDMKEDITVSVHETAVELKCAGADVTIPLKDKMKQENAQNGADTVCVRMKTADFINGVTKGGYFPDTNDVHSTRNLLQINMELVGDAARLLFLTFSGFCAASCVETGSVSHITEEVKKRCENIVVAPVSCDNILGLCNKLEYENTDLFFNHSQLVINNGADFYIFRCLSSGYAETVAKTMTQDKISADCTTNITVDSKSLLKAIEVASIGIEKETPILLQTINGQLCVSNELQKCQQLIDCEQTGEFNFSGYGPFIKTAVEKNATSKVTLRISNGGAIYVEGNGADDATALIAPRKSNKNITTEENGTSAN